jgi:GNAT superfamily N-acetyltransferase
MTNAHRIVGILLDAQSKKFGLKTYEPGVYSSPGGEELSAWLNEPGSLQMVQQQGVEKKVYEEPVYPHGMLEYYSSEYGSWRILWRDLAVKAVVGAVQGVSRGRLHILSNIYVKPDRRKAGIGTVLTNAAKQWKRGLKLTSTLTDMGREFARVR